MTKARVIVGRLLEDDEIEAKDFLLAAADVPREVKLAVWDDRFDSGVEIDMVPWLSKATPDEVQDLFDSMSSPPYVIVYGRDLVDNKYGRAFRGTIFYRIAVAIRNDAKRREVLNALGQVLVLARRAYVDQGYWDAKATGSFNARNLLTWVRVHRPDVYEQMDWPVALFGS